MDRPLHGGPVSPWPRRARRFARGCRVVLQTGLLALVVSGLVIAALAHLGTLAVGIALTVVVLVVWALVGIRPLTVVLMHGVPRRNGETVSVAMVWVGSLGPKSIFLHVGSGRRGGC